MSSSTTEFTIIGLKLHYFIGDDVYDSGQPRFTYFKKEIERYVICLTRKIGKSLNPDMYELTLYESYGECYSGWTTATWGNYSLSRVNAFGAMTHVINTPTTITVELNNDKFPNTYSCDVFDYSASGVDDYYPSGSVNVNMACFNATGRGFSKHPVWIFSGSSNLGKSYVAQMVYRAYDDEDQFTVFETDSCAELPDTIYADIVVVGNKYNVDLEILKTKIMGEPIYVNFSR